MSRCQFVADHQDAYEVKRLCELVEVERSSFYAWKAAAPTRAARAAADAQLASRIRAVRTGLDDLARLLSLHGETRAREVREWA